MPIKIDYSRDDLLDDFAKKTMRQFYMLEHEKSPQEAFARAAQAFVDNDEHAQRLYDYASKLWFMFSTPVLANGGTTRGLPISCFLNFIPDSRQGIFDNWTEDGWLSSNGGGIGTYVGALRSDGAKTSRGSSSTGSIPFMKVKDSITLAISQGDTRRGSTALYQDISHPEIEEFLHIRKPTGGDLNRKALNIHHGINIPDSFMQIIERCMLDKDANDDWDLIDPHSKRVVKTVSAKALWEEILRTRVATGEPYLHFIDTSNKALHPAFHELGLSIKQSNLCTEILLPTNEKRTAVCCLSSVNLEYYDEWKNTNMVRDLIRMLDNVLDIFIKTAPKGLEKAIFSAWSERSLGLGAMGFHAYLQSKNLPFDSPVSKSVNKLMFSKIREQANIETCVLGNERGSAPDMEGQKITEEMIQQWVNGNGTPEELKGKTAKKRNSHLLAVAPNANSSILCGNTSPSIEPYSANVIKQVTRAGSNISKNKFLSKLIDSKGLTDKEKEKVWDSIINNHGSVQHLDILTENEKEVFKTALEIDQRWVIEHASDRQVFIDQGQSVNLFVASNIKVQELHHLHYLAWKKGLKTLYYLRTDSTRKVEKVNAKIEKFDYKTEDCIACEG